MRGRRQQHGPEERQPAPRVAEEHEALMGAVDPLSQLLDPHGHPVAAALEPRGQPVDGVACPGGADHGDEHDDADDAEDPEAGAEQPVVGDPQHHVVLRERLAGAEVDGEGAREGEEDDGCDERHERRRHRLGQPHARTPHHPHHRGTRTGLERCEIGRPRAHPAREHHVAEPHAGMHMPVPDRVIIRNARQHNLKGITVELPRRALTVITGPSGSGKSSLAFDTLYAEGQRRYIESLSTYAKQFLERMPKPLVDGIDGISPAVAIEQKNPTTTSRSTVGTATEIYDFLRLLWARVGTPYCVKCGREVKADTVQEVVDALIAECGVRSAEFEGADHSAFRTPNSALVVAFPLPPTAHRPEVDVAAQLRAAGFVRAQVDGALVRLDAPEAEQRVREGAEGLVAVDRVAAADASPGRRTDSVGTSFTAREGGAVTVCNAY